MLEQVDRESHLLKVRKKTHWVEIPPSTALGTALLIPVVHYSSVLLEAASTEEVLWQTDS